MVARTTPDSLLRRARLGVAYEPAAAGRAAGDQPQSQQLHVSKASGGASCHRMVARMTPESMRRSPTASMPPCTCVCSAPRALAVTKPAGAKRAGRAPGYTHTHGRADRPGVAALARRVACGCWCDYTKRGASCAGSRCRWLRHGAVASPPQHVAPRPTPYPMVAPSAPESVCG